MSEQIANGTDANLPALENGNGGLRALASKVNVTGNGLEARTLAEIMDFGQLMAKAGPMVGKAFRGNPGACVGITMQAMRWGMDPFAVSQKAYVTEDKHGVEAIAYEAQLISAVINKHAPIIAPPVYSFDGAGPQRRCSVRATLRGAREPSVYDTPPLNQLTGRSPLWTKDPDQQLSYYAIRAWARRYCPEIILGVYAPDELQDGAIIDVTPETTAPLENEGAPAERLPFLRGKEKNAVVDAFRARFEAAESEDDLEAIWADVETYRSRVSGLTMNGLEGLRDMAEARLERAYKRLADPILAALDDKPNGPVAIAAQTVAEEIVFSEKHKAALFTLKKAKTLAALTNAYSAIESASLSVEEVDDLTSWFNTFRAEFAKEGKTSSKAIAGAPPSDGQATGAVHPQLPGAQP